MDIFSFEKNLLKKHNIDLLEISLNFDNINVLNCEHLQAFFEIQPMLLNFLKYKYFIEQNSLLFDNTHISKNTTYLKIIKIIDEEKKIFNLKINPTAACNQLLILILFQTLNNSLVISESDDLDIRWCGVYDVFRNFSNVIEKFFIYFEMGGVVGVPPQNSNKAVRDLIASILNVCIFNGIIKKKTEADVMSPKKKCAFYAMNLGPTFEADWVYLDLKIHFKQPRIIDDGVNKYSCGFHYLSVSKIFRENIKSNRVFFLKNLSVWEKLRNLTYQLDYNFYAQLSEKIIKKYDLSVVDPFEDVFKKYLKSKKMIFLTYFQKKNSLYYNLLVFFYLSKYKSIFSKPFFLSYFFDFRGRIYSDSVISPIGNRIFRFLYNYGLYDNADLQINQEFPDETLKNYQHIVENSNLIFLFKNLKVTNYLIKKVVSTIFFEFGKLVKSDHMDKFDGRLTETDFIKIGIDFFNDFMGGGDELLLNNFELYLEAHYLLNILKNYNDGVYIKHIIYKDATASAIQLLMVLLGSHDQDKIKICNLNDKTYWYDTYYFIIKEFKAQHILGATSLPHFTRKNLKKTIMTYNYSATMLTCWKDFSENISFTNDQYQQIFDDFQKFFNFLKEIFDGDLFFKNPSKKLIEFFKKDFKLAGEIKVTTPDHSHTYLEYKKSTSIRIDKKYKDLRFTIVFWDLSDELDIRKTYQSLRPNLLHSLDATLVRIILNKLPHPIITIHDSFGIDLLSVDLLIQTANIAFNLLQFEGVGNNYTEHQSKFILI